MFEATRRRGHGNKKRKFNRALILRFSNCHLNAFEKREMAAPYRTETFGGEKVDISTEKCADSIEYCRELAKLRNAEVGDECRARLGVFCCFSFRFRG